MFQLYLKFSLTSNVLVYDSSTATKTKIIRTTESKTFSISFDIIKTNENYHPKLAHIKNKRTNKKSNSFFIDVVGNNLDNLLRAVRTHLKALFGAETP